MHVVIVSDYETQGGAAVAASRLARGLCRRHRVTRIVLKPDGNAHPWRTVAFRPHPPALPASRAARLFLKAACRLLPRVFALPDTPQHAENRLDRLLGELKPDIVNLHNLHGGAPLGWSPGMLEVAARHAPVVWTLHDMWSFTGRCAYAYDCRRFESGCDARCPTPQEHPVLPADRIAQAWRQRRALLQKHREVVAVTPSAWLADQAWRGFWIGHRIEVVPYGLDTELYRPMDLRAARQALALPLEGPLVLTAAEDLTERRKGALVLAELWKLLPPGLFTLVTLGRGEVPGFQGRVLPLGFRTNESEIALACNAADLLLHPAPVDNFPNVVLEALSCGTPAVSLPVGGLPEIIRPGRSGWLAREATAAALAESLQIALRSVANGQDCRGACRAQAVAEYDNERQAECYERLFRQMADPAGRAATVASGGRQHLDTVDHLYQ